MAFEADAYDHAGGNGWSVTVTGRASEVTDAVELERLHELPLAPYARGVRDNYVLIPIELVDGRRVGTSVPCATAQVPAPARTTSRTTAPLTATTNQDLR